jgi:cytochrome b561
MPTTGRYNRLAIGLHWIIAALIILQIGYAWWCLAPLKDDSPEQAKALAFHFSIGLTILLLSLARLGVRIAAPPPPLPVDMPGLEKTMARLTHALFYVLIIGIPLGGWVLASLHPDPIIFFRPVRMAPPAILVRSRQGCQPCAAQSRWRHAHRDPGLDDCGAAGAAYRRRAEGPDFGVPSVLADAALSASALRALERSRRQGLGPGRFNRVAASWLFARARPRSTRPDRRRSVRTPDRGCGPPRRWAWRPRPVSGRSGRS